MSRRHPKGRARVPTIVCLDPDLDTWMKCHLPAGISAAVFVNSVVRWEILRLHLERDYAKKPTSLGELIRDIVKCNPP